MSTTFSAIVRDFANAIKGKSNEEIAALADTSGTHLNLTRRRLQRYDAAQAIAPRYGIIGVGAISFAEMRVATFNRRAARAIDASHG